MPKKTDKRITKTARRRLPPRRTLVHQPKWEDRPQTEDAPPTFSVHASFEPNHACLWIGLDDGPGDPDAKRICYAMIRAEQLRQLAEDVLRCYPSSAKGGAR